ncbi:probable phosphatidylglycerophosphatase mitochondrial [Phtheirospermum japonicum]|uniref:Probable phosphatidylglycerophosphatase mitochondrial n=1 Tax=Phtheirospermum japonicum TaxID=374723 RepID=A0A830BVA7_9LAMI|nr:probable phosphatidylglycerophosphatase mitochondrial [Phtheirospermum japonicum]
MLTTPIASWQSGSYYPVPNNLFSQSLHFHRPTKITLNSKPRKPQCTNHSLLTLTATQSCSKEQGNKKHNHRYPEDNTPYPAQDNRESLQDYFSPSETPEPQFEEGEKERGFGENNSPDISSNMWWADLKAALGQRINLEGIACSVGILSKDKQLAIPHVSVPDIRRIDWAELKKRGFEGVVFDKDNTITAPYSLSLWPPLTSSVEQCKSLFGTNVAVFSNSAGLYEYDPDGRKAGALEDAIGIKVIRHGVKKPAGAAEEIESHFGCKSSRLIMVGDRPFTDIVYGNRNGFFTILTEPLSLAEEPLIVRQVRLLEVAIVKQWSKKGLMPLTHELLSDPVECVKDVPL